MVPGRALQVIILVASLGTIAGSDGKPVISMPLRMDSFYGPSKVTLSCGEATMAVTFWRHVDDNSPDQRLELQGRDESSDSDQAMFEVPPSLEGRYYCKSGNVTSVNFLEIVAFPLQNLTIANMKSFSVDVGGNVTLPCAYDTPGVLRNRYHVEWYRGHREPLQNSNTQLPQRYTVNEDDFSLTIRNANVDDSSQAYYCALRVENLEASRDIYRLGPTFELRVQSTLEVIGRVEDVVIKPSSKAQARFTCTVSGSPEPSIMWTLQGRAIHALGKPGKFQEQHDSSSSPTAKQVTSHLTVRQLEVGDSGDIHCVALSDNGDTVVTTRARLVVLPQTASDFAVEIQSLQGGSAVLKADLPTVIPGVFSLVVLYIENEDTTSSTDLFDVQFADTGTVEYEIPREKLPRFTTFRVSVALKVGGVQSASSQQSNLITVSEPPGATPSSSTDQCDCSSKDTGDNSDADLEVIWVPTLIISFAVIVIATVFLVLVVYFCGRKPKMVPNASNVYYSDKEESIHTSRSPSRASSGAASFTSEQLAEREKGLKEIGGMAIVDMSNEDLFRASTLPRGRRPPSEDADVRSRDFVTQVPYQS